MTTSSSYIHGTSAEEQQRLGLMNDLLNESCLAELKLQGGERILDLGCGTGLFSRVLARAVGPRGRVLGIERSVEQLTAARRGLADSSASPNLELRQGDAFAPPLTEGEWGSFDVAWTRFLLEHVRQPLAIVRQLVRATRPGGRIVLADDDHEVLRLWPEPPGLMSLWNAYLRTYDRLGNDPYIGRRLVALLHEAGACPVRNTWLFFGGCAGNPRFEVVVRNLRGILVGAREEILRQELFPEVYFDRTLATYDEWAQRPDAAFWFALCWAEGVRPE